MALNPITYTNNGPASTSSPHYLIDGDSTDGTAIAPNGGPVSFFGVTPVEQQNAITALGNSATGTEIATAVNALITVLENFGFVAPN